jgi:preprotein translocase subunit YajC
MTLYGIFALLAQAAAPTAEDPRAQGIKMIGMMVIFVVIMWFLMIAPQRKKAKEQDNLLKALRPGDKVVTSSGIIAVVLTIKDKSVSIRSAETKLEILKSAITDVTERSETGEAKS